MYRIDGGSELPEQVLSHLEGYRSSQPVRVGNAAAKQLQLDTFGELLHCVYTHHWRDHPPPSKEDLKDLLCLISHVTDFVLTRWREPDHGIWEFRDRPRYFVYSKVMSWVALDRAIKLVRELKLPLETGKWEEAGEEIRRTVLEKGYDPKLESFVQAFDETALDASALLFPILGFIAPDDPKMVSTVGKIQEALRSRHFLYRYIMDDGLPGREGAFLACSFWLVDAFTLMGRVDEAEAEAEFERLLTFANDLGLYAEEIDPITEEALGNFPQAFTHVGLINAAVNLEKAKQGEQRENFSEEAAKEGSYDE
ncbi:glycoside hydrolase family 15 protein [Candidatus Manganitrophus noduliformans]|uniref:glycoside hydrolase family 15 protein n=1 Tax=Candidatus Manganitrophus noduliformans TaxID=2606439 RepID=UPI002353B922|nr:glycoside hydrolase family 15 protein [Candidatus Manganitrophus noduliformans]